MNEREWFCAAEAGNLDTAWCSPDDQIHDDPCGWMGELDESEAAMALVEWTTAASWNCERCGQGSDVGDVLAAAREHNEATGHPTRATQHLSWPADRERNER